jgi:prepilin-type N-terminal cleavage/methylation domain-containing protein/prepilin-type processing-associated H-X9-DG protein
VALSPLASTSFSGCDGSGRTIMRIRFHQAAFTVIELLVVIFIIGILIALLVPAVQVVRESGRITQCKNNLRQLGLGLLQHEQTQGRFPSNGWGYRWTGEPDRGTGPNQPAGWIYNILPYLEQPQMRELGLRESGAARQASLSQLIQTPLPVLMCRNRAVKRAPLNPVSAPFNAQFAPLVARTDYAVNEGDFIPRGGPGPGTLAEGDDPRFPWPDTSRVTGICYLRSQIYLAQIRDGQSHTYLVGEKYVMVDKYFDVTDPGYDQHPYCGVDLDINRWTASPPRADGLAPGERMFGSGHPAGCNFVFCDGAVRTVRYEIDPELHRRLGNRQDRLPVDLSAL